MAIIFKHCRGYFHKYILITMMENLHSSLHLLRFRQDWETFTNTYSKTYIQCIQGQCTLDRYMVLLPNQVLPGPYKSVIAPYMSTVT